jgi:hypothetical protein
MAWDAESRESSRRKVMHYALAKIHNRKHEYPRRVQRLLRASYDIHIQDMAAKIAVRLTPTRELLQSPDPRID